MRSFVAGVATLSIAIAVAASPPRANGPVNVRSHGFAKLTRQDPHVGDFRLWGEIGCITDNLGVWTVTQSNLDTCYGLPGLVKAVNLTNIVDGCYFHVFGDTGCSGGSYTYEAGSGCSNAVDGIDSWKAFVFSCPTPD
ncbi:hypothetical protein B0T25DRAFT_4056 [Lasiosphaeria hispida]|uniref:Uncharacterized protein n=1 Tax=Lasiosphaeria hispida TaxID=260671 RepID=A0AAJ0HTK0_9PEZI|nr:hypothetical protein B0T25DRAFT_4056 [Lasiosphaeria hispida]